MSGSTTIKLSHDTKEKLRQRGEKGDTYEDIILDLMEAADEVEGAKDE